MFKHKWSTRNGTSGEKHHLERCAMYKACNLWEEHLEIAKFTSEEPGFLKQWNSLLSKLMFK